MNHSIIVHGEPAISAKPTAFLGQSSTHGAKMMTNFFITIARLFEALCAIIASLFRLDIARATPVETPQEVVDHARTFDVLAKAKAMEVQSPPRPIAEPLFRLDHVTFKSDYVTVELTDQDEKKYKFRLELDEFGEVDRNSFWPNAFSSALQIIEDDDTRAQILESLISAVNLQVQKQRAAYVNTILSQRVLAPQLKLN